MHKNTEPRKSILATEAVLSLRLANELEDEGEQQRHPRNTAHGRAHTYRSATNVELQLLDGF